MASWGWEAPQVPGELLPLLRKVNFGVGKHRIKQAKEVMDQVTARIVRFLQTKHRLVIRSEYAGSSFEGTKIEKPDEYDVLIVLDGRGLVSEEFHPQFCALRPSGRVDTFNEFLSSGMLEPFKVRAKMQSWVARAINELAHTWNEFDVRFKQSGPATTLMIQAKSSKYREVGTICVDLVPAFQLSNDYYYVAKPCELKLSNTVNQHLLWRKSFSLHEKRELRNIDSDGGCRRQCLKILKFMRLRDAPLKYLASYHYKVLVLRECEMHYNRDDWRANRLAERLWGVLASLAGYLHQGRLPHVLDESVDVFETVCNETALRNLRDRVRRMMNKGSDEIKAILERSPEPQSPRSYKLVKVKNESHDSDTQDETEKGSSVPWKTLGLLFAGAVAVLAMGMKK